VLTLSIPENHSRRDDAGEWVQTGTTFYNVTRWGGQTSSAEVEAIATGLHKGDLALIVGTLRTREYQHDGETRRGVELIADEIAALFRGQTVTVTRNGGGVENAEAPVDYQPTAY
jgi:single-strand DNA-binding protein